MSRGADINTMDKKDAKNKNANYSVMAAMESFASKKFIQLDEQKRKTVIIASIVLAIILLIGSTVGYFLQLPSAINILLGAPAGIVFYFILFVEAETMRGKLTEFKEKYTFRERGNKLIKYWALLLPLIIFTNIIPVKPLGGSIIIAAFLASVSIIRKTDKENYYVTNGLIDPREIEDEE